MKTKQLFFLLLAFNLCLLAASPVNANDGNSEHHESSSNHENDDHTKCDTDDKGGNRAPIDGGIGILLATGIGYGVKKVMNRNKIKAENNQL